MTAGLTFSVALGIGTVMQYGDALAARIGVDTGEVFPSAEEQMRTTLGRQMTPMPAPTVRVPTADRGVAVARLPGGPDQPLAVPGGFATGAPDVAARPADPVAETAPDVPAEAPAMALEAPTAPAGVAATDNDAARQAASLPDTAPAASPVASVTAEAVTEEPAPETRRAATCRSSMTATSAPLAMVTLALTDPCRPNMRVTFHHEGLMFQVATDATGTVELTVPALSQNALFIADFAEGLGAMASIEVPDLANYDRAALQWRGEAGMQLHALEFGAAYGEPGHVWSDASGSADTTLAGSGGLLTQLGDPSLDPALMAEVYTFPSGQTRRDGTVSLSVEAEVTARNCGREITAEALQIGRDGVIDGTDVVLTMPGCDAIGEYLVLKNMLEDLKLAAR